MNRRQNKIFSKVCYAYASSCLNYKKKQKIMQKKQQQQQKRVLNNISKNQYHSKHNSYRLPCGWIPNPETLVLSKFGCGTIIAWNGDPIICWSSNVILTE